METNGDNWRQMETVGDSRRKKRGKEEKKRFGDAQERNVKYLVVPDIQQERAI